jgi:lipopolysaccharide/colanic/teichoic acid biosynthesis glycosyltransferase
MTVVRTLWNVLNQVVGAIALVLLSPVILAVALYVRIADGKGVLFKQARAGRGGVPFTMLKFRSMVHDSVAMTASMGIADPFGLIEDDPRITTCGRFLRRTSLDELPQLINVVRGQMVLVGPRPDVLPQVANYSALDARRLEVKPGITGWAQVNGRDAIDWPERFKLDRWYIDHWTPALDLKILWRTFTSLNRDEVPVRVDELNIKRAQDVGRAAA